MRELLYSIYCPFLGVLQTESCYGTHRKECTICATEALENTAYVHCISSPCASSFDTIPECVRHLVKQGLRCFSRENPARSPSCIAFDKEARHAWLPARIQGQPIKVVQNVSLCQRGRQILQIVNIIFDTYRSYYRVNLH